MTNSLPDKVTPGLTRPLQVWVPPTNESSKFVGDKYWTSYLVKSRIHMSYRNGTPPFNPPRKRGGIRGGFEILVKTHFV